MLLAPLTSPLTNAETLVDELAWLVALPSSVLTALFASISVLANTPAFTNALSPPT